MMTMRRSPLAALLLALAFVSGACASGGVIPRPRPPVVTPPVVVPAPAPPLVVINIPDPDAPTAVAWRCGEALKDIRADLGSMLDVHGDLMWTGNTAGAIVHGRWEDWAARMRAAGLTHVVVGDFHAGGYPGFPVPNPDMVRDPAAIRAILERIQNTPAADGKGFTPIIQFDGGEYPDSTPDERIERDWPVLEQAIKGDGSASQRDLNDCSIKSPGWELIKASPWPSRAMSHALTWMHAHGLKWLAVHNSIGRTAISSNPGEPDDPWRRWSWPLRDAAGQPVRDERGDIRYETGRRMGDDAEQDKREHPDPLGQWGGAEAESLQTNGGQFADFMFFQVDPPRPGQDLHCPYLNNSSCFRDRFNDMVTRVGNGYHSWRKMIVVAFETMVYTAFHGPEHRDWYKPWAGSAAFARDVASALKEVCDRPMTPEGVMPPVDCKWGNGLPWGMAGTPAR